MSVKNESGTYNHYHKDMINQNTTVNPKKMVRLAQELADLSNSLPDQNTNAIFVRVDTERVDVMKAIITGSN
jgi:baculoviral IAP repeat-containing protein 6